MPQAAILAPRRKAIGRRRLIFFWYRVLAGAAFPLFLLYVGSRGLRDRRYFRGLGARFGCLPPHVKATPPGAVWLHAVSVGEVLSAVGLVHALRTAIPGVPIVVSCTTLAG